MRQFKLSIYSVRAWCSGKSAGLAVQRPVVRAQVTGIFFKIVLLWRGKTIVGSIDRLELENLH